VKRNSIDQLGELQRLVLETVWELGEATVHEVRDRLARKRELAYTTVLSVMQKLEKAGWLNHRSEGRRHVYFATHTREDAGQHSLRRFVSRLFKGDNRAVLQHLLEDENLTDDELMEFRKMIDRRRKELKND
jgi:predicted transcriptional regulator